MIPGSEFCEYCKPTDDCKIDDKVIEITKIDPELINKAASIKIVWPKFVNYVTKYNSDKTTWNAPIAVAHNLIGFDLPIALRMNELFCEKGKDTVLFNLQQKVDTVNLMFFLFENVKEVNNYKLNTLRDFFGLSKDNAHKADTDVEHLGMISMRILKFLREVVKSYLPQMRGSFKRDLKALANEKS
jgi:DNA polymerase III alpha subunit (gram-positive type)